MLIGLDCLIDGRCIVSNALKRQEQQKKKMEPIVEAVETPDRPTADEDGAAATLDAKTQPAAEPPISGDEIAELRMQAGKAKETHDQLLRTMADFENFRKRTARERQDAVKFANESLLQKLIPVMDNFDMAIAAAATAQEGTAQSLQTGVNMILSQLRSTLTEAGLEEIDATGKPFDPNFHEAVSQQETSDVPEGHVMQQLRKGYRLRERLLRPATVIVAKNPAS
jgi:molecular chaperone GrpE